MKISTIKKIIHKQKNKKIFPDNKFIIKNLERSSIKILREKKYYKKNILKN